ncbi:hypothetical protein CA54_27410 [Symmachiella macrocystis]|uniref:PilZ domain-containing protein n=1 Tax=Symmachiella macrocystis TaxID=2527985 RepID=A0A5C6BSP2_9PLAN|nr:PilZ domain-containing protein [Symmachiella macrocystis]TWU13899.1 hypothetical protein CA54_27410 [Symmachiella macrocystis]
MKDSSHLTSWGGQDCLTSTNDLTTFVKDLIPRQSHTGREMRINLRRSFVAEILVQKVNKDCQPVEDEFVTVTRDISVGGLCFIAPIFIETPLVIVQIEHPSGVTKRLLMEVCRCRPFRKYFEVGGPFVTNVP